MRVHTSFVSPCLPYFSKRKCCIVSKLWTKILAKKNGKIILFADNVPCQLFPLLDCFSLHVIHLSIWKNTTYIYILYFNILTLRRNIKATKIYEVPLSDGKKYIGETSRPLATRLKEHAEAVRKLDVTRNAIAQYVATSTARPIWEETRILAREENWYRRRVKEAIWIERQENLNRNHGLEEVTAAWQVNNLD